MATALSVTGAVLLAAGLVAPRALAAPNRVWWRFAQVLGWINTRVLLTAFFFAVITPVGVVMRLCGRNPLQARPGSGWLASSPRRRPPSHYDHLF